MNITEGRLACLPRSFVTFIQIFSEQTSASLKNSALVAHPVHVVLLNFSKEHKKSLFRSEHSLVVFLSDETEKSEGMREVDIARPCESVYGYSK